MNKLKNMVIVIRQGENFFGLNSQRIVEILPMPKITKVPRQMEYIRGISNYKGSVVPILSLNLLANGKSCESEQVCIFFKSGEQVLGLAVDEVMEMIYDIGEAIGYDGNDVGQGRIRIRKVLRERMPVFVLDIPRMMKEL